MFLEKTNLDISMWDYLHKAESESEGQKSPLFCCQFESSAIKSQSIWLVEQRSIRM